MCMLRCLGLIENQKSSILNPAQVIEFLGFRHSPNGVETPMSGQDKSVESRAVLTEEQVLGRALVRLVGKMNATSQVDLTIATIISAPTNGSRPLNHTQSTPSVLRGTCSPENRGHGGTDVVGHPHDELEWKIPPLEGSGHKILMPH